MNQDDFERKVAQRLELVMMSGGIISNRRCHANPSTLSHEVRREASKGTRLAALLSMVDGHES